MLIFVIFSLLITILAVVFALQNTAAVTVTFLFWQIQGSLALVLLVAFIAGAVMSYFASLPAIFKDKWALRSQRKRLTELEAALTVHRSRLEEAQSQLAAANAPALPLPPEGPVSAPAPQAAPADAPAANGNGQVKA